MHTVGAFEAKTYLAQLLDIVEQGETVTITRRGKPVAKMVPPATVSEPPDVDAVIKAMEEFQRTQGPKLGKSATVRQLLEEGRR